MRELPNLALLHERHHGLTPDLCRAYAEAAAVCFSRYHTSPLKVTLMVSGREEEWQIRWQEPTVRQLLAWANRIDAVEMGAYSVALASVEVAVGLFAIMRTRELSGADYYVGEAMGVPGYANLRNAYRLEVSGLGRGDLPQINARLNRKIDQVRRGRVFNPGLACVVGFKSGIIRVEAC